ncbi:MAG: TIGR04076 family protein [Chloroflexi bacterium]|jgi:uncharacterized repeat protein (TIGR04076 family)|nr:TIGR04076 family protein [Chloroflexota bacterium]MBT7080385.1 TIGR04076 family protein [Chloroflexota bacterium]MBT7289445.1 TIGR04076 family protein [Chloroflexota bacterium]
MFYDVTVKIISAKGHCTAGHKVGEEWVVGPHTPAGICVAAFNSLIPTIRVLRYNGFYGSESGPNTTQHTIACQDGDNPVIFEVKRIRE